MYKKETFSILKNGDVPPISFSHHTHLREIVINAQKNNYKKNERIIFLKMYMCLLDVFAQ